MASGGLYPFHLGSFLGGLFVVGYDYTRSTNIAQAGLRKPLETLGFIGVSRNAYLAHIRPIGGACQVWRGRGAWRVARGRGGESGGRAGVDVSDMREAHRRTCRAQARTWHAVRGVPG